MGVLQLISKFYEERPAGGGVDVGDLWWVPVAFIDQVPRMLDVERASATDHYATKFTIREVGSTDFRSKPKLPVKLLNLEDTEELLIAKAKRRPVVILSKSLDVNVTSLPATEQKRAAATVGTTYLVAPLYSPQSTSFPPAFVARIRALTYPQFACLPRLGSQVPEAGEIVRLDRLFTSHLGRGCEAVAGARSGTKLRLSDEARVLLLDQRDITISGVVIPERHEAFVTVRDLAKDALPDDLRSMI